MVAINPESSLETRSPQGTNITTINIRTITIRQIEEPDEDEFVSLEDDDEEDNDETQNDFIKQFLEFLLAISIFRLLQKLLEEFLKHLLRPRITLLNNNSNNIQDAPTPSERPANLPSAPAEEAPLPLLPPGHAIV